MALLGRLSIKWKLSFALIASGFFLVGTYVFIAKRIFESDKISYVFDSQNSRLESSRGEIESKFERSLLSARSLIATFDFNAGKLSAAGEDIFQGEKNLLAIELWSENRKAVLIRLEKQASLLPPSGSQGPELPLNEVQLSPLGKSQFLLGLKFISHELGPVVLRAVLDIDHLLPTPSLTQSIALVQENSVIATSDLRGLPTEAFSELAASTGRTQQSLQQTKTAHYAGGNYLVSELPLSLAHLRLVAMTPEKEALGALSTLFNRSILFLLVSAFALIIVSLSLARGLTANLSVLTKAAHALGRGNFDTLSVIKSEDEMGILSAAFSKMSQEIKRLLVETREKTRMEAELKTASLIQERLLPRESNFRKGEIEVNGLVLTSTECGGDWWFHFSKGDELYIAIADATGHGTPAALITASARSIFSRFEREDLSLGQMMEAWDIAVSSCSQKQVFMTGFLIRIHTQTGEGAYVNAGHDHPFIFRRDSEGKFAVDHFDTEPSRRIGDGITADTAEGRFCLAPYDSILLYTDGLFAVERADGKKLSEKRFGLTIAKASESVFSAKDLTDTTMKAFNKHREGALLPDDVSVVSIRRLDPVSKTLESSYVSGVSGPRAELPH